VRLNVVDLIGPLIASTPVMHHHPARFGTPLIRSLLVCATAAGVVLLSTTPTARATRDAGPPPPDLGYCPADTMQVSPNGDVPANFGGVVLVMRASGAPTSAELRVERREDVGGPLALMFSIVPIDATQVRVQITDPLAAGASIRVSVQPCADISDVERWDHTFLEITPTAPEPTNLGRIVGPGHSDVHFDGTTWYQIAYYFPSDEARPWQSAYWASLEIDGVVQAEQYSLAVEAFLPPNNPVACPGSPPDGLTPGAHTFRLAGGPWGEPARAYTDPFTVTIDCPPPPPPESRGCIDFGLYPDGGPAGGYCPVDAGPPPPFDPLCFDGGGCMDGGAPIDANVPAPPDSGCAVVAGASGGPIGVGAFFLILLTSFTVRRRLSRRA